MLPFDVSIANTSERSPEITLRNNMHCSFGRLSFELSVTFQPGSIGDLYSKIHDKFGQLFSVEHPLVWITLHKLRVNMHKKIFWICVNIIR